MDNNFMDEQPQQIFADYPEDAGIEPIYYIVTANPKQAELIVTKYNFPLPTDLNTLYVACKRLADSSEQAKADLFAIHPDKADVLKYAGVSDSPSSSSCKCGGKCGGSKDKHSNYCGCTNCSTANYSGEQGRSVGNVERVDGSDELFPEAKIDYHGVSGLPKRDKPAYDEAAFISSLSGMTIPQLDGLYSSIEIQKNTGRLSRDGVDALDSQLSHINTARQGRDSSIEETFMEKLKSTSNTTKVLGAVALFAIIVVAYKQFS